MKFKIGDILGYHIGDTPREVVGFNYYAVKYEVKYPSGKICDLHKAYVEENFIKINNNHNYNQYWAKLNED